MFLKVIKFNTMYLKTYNKLFLCVGDASCEPIMVDNILCP